MITFESRGFGDTDDPYGDYGTYFVFMDGEKQLWCSTLFDYRDLAEAKYLTELRNEILEAADRYGVRVDVSSDSYWAWKQIEPQLVEFFAYEIVQYSAIDWLTPEQIKATLRASLSVNPNQLTNAINPETRNNPPEEGTESRDCGTQSDDQRDS